MNGPVDERADRIHALAIRQLDGTMSPEERTELVDLLQGNAAVRRTYLGHMQDTVSLRWIFSGHYDRRMALALAERGPEGMLRLRRRARAWAMLAVAAGLACFAAWPFLPLAEERGPVGAQAEDASAARPAIANDIATVTNVSDMRWTAGAAAAKFLSRVTVGQQFDFAQGTLELTFDTGAQVKVFGPAAFEVKSPRWIRCARGRVTTLVGEDGKGFTIDTPKARIVDLGTEFGVDISEKGDTQVVVFQGSVDLTPPESDAGAGQPDATKWTRRLQQGDALLVDDSGEAQRVMAVQRGDFFPASLTDLYGRHREPIVLDVADNIRAGESSKCYQIVRGGLREDAPSFVDRGHQWNGVDGAGIPEFLLGADYVMPFNDDKFIADLRVDVKVARPATCYVFLDDNMAPPAWLLKHFEDTGKDIGMDSAKTVWHKEHATDVGPGKSIDFVFSIWRRNLPKAGVLTLGGVDAPKVGNRSAGFNMYGIAVVPK